VAESGSEEIDERFNELIRTEYPGAATNQRAQPEVQPFSFDEAIDAAEPSDEEARHRPDVAPAPAVRGRVLAGAVLLGFGVMMGLLALFGANWPNVVSWLAVATAVAGLAVLLFSVPRRRDGIGDGSQV